MAKRERLDLALVARGLASTRQKAQALILAGVVEVNGVRSDKAGTPVLPDSSITLRQDESRYVSRGGDKLEGALRFFDISLDGEVCLDVGASTGGFTHCMLLSGAQSVYAVDVGTLQLDSRLRDDPRVSVFENFHANRLSREMFRERPFSFFTVDVSFISVRKVLRWILDCVESSARGLILVKPQFELEPSAVARGGVVREESEQLRAVGLVLAWLQSEGVSVDGVAKSELKGSKKGNQEYFVYCGVQR